MHPEEAEFHRQLSENPQDETTADVYADWLEENSRPATAEIIRKHNQLSRSVRDADSTGNYTTGTYLYNQRFPASTGIGYATQYPEAGKDSVNIHVPSLSNPKHTYAWTAWIPRSSSKRLVSQLANEGLPLRNPEGPNDIETRRVWDSDKTTPPEPHQMSRDKPKLLVVSYDKHLSRFSLNKKYAASTVARVMGHSQYGNEIAPINQGSRLATVLREIKHGVGKNNPVLDKLTTHALGGTHKPEVYTAIRDELFRSKDPRAVQLARQYNWHKVGEGLERDRYLKQFVENSAKGTTHEGHSQQFRRFYNGVVHAKNGPDDNTRQLFYKAMRKHLQDSTGKDHSYEDIENSLRRLGETEENKERLGGGKGSAKFELPDYEHPAYTGVPKEGKAPPKRQITPTEKRAPGQYQRPRFRFKL